MIDRRAAGTLLHPTSLPGRWGIGDLGVGATAFLTWLAAAGQTAWQILPLGPTAQFNSPYGSPSAFAGNPLLIAPDELLEEGFLPAAALRDAPELVDERVDFATVVPFKHAVLRRSWQHFCKHAPPLLRDELDAFVNDPAHAAWLPDWALFCALKERNGGREWQRWDTELRARDARALASARAGLDDEVRFHAYLQFLFFRQWQRVRAEAGRREIAILGDIPIYVALDSADVWAHQRYFTLDGEGMPTTVAGVPPDYFSATGQRWGNPLYRWDRLEEDGYSWWIERLRMAFRLTDIVRIDHFRGFAGYWEIPASESTAINGRWLPGPGTRLFGALRAALGDVRIVAEDLGFITPDVGELRDALGFPGMKVMQFGFREIDSEHLPHRFQPNMVVYTGTHDNDTTAGWFAAAPATERRRALAYLGGGPDQVHWGMLRALYTSAAGLAVAPLQDVLGLGSDARMNLPGRAAGNWEWRARREHFTPELAARMRELATLTGRVR